MKKIIPLILLICMLLAFCSCNRGLPVNAYTTEAHTEEPETETDAQTGIDPTLLNVTAWLVSTRDDVLGITWYYDGNLPRSVFDNLIYIYIGVYDSGRYSLRLRAQYYGEKANNTDKFVIVADNKTYTVDTAGRLKTGTDGNNIWEMADIIPRGAELDAVAAAAGAKDVYIRAYSGGEFIERVLQASEQSSLLRMLKLYRALTGEDTAYDAETVTDTAETSDMITGLDDLITTVDGLSTLTYGGYSIKFPKAYSCTSDGDGKVFIAKKKNDGEAVIIEKHERNVYVQTITDEVVKSTLQTFQSKLGEGTAAIYEDAKQTTLGGKPAVKYVYKTDFETCSVFITVYIVQNGENTYTVSVSELTYGGTILLSIASTLHFYDE